jgi:RHS repeat-associated protein
MPNEKYDFDLNGNRKKAEIQGKKQTYQTGEYNCLISDENYRYEYDPEGNRISKTNKTNNETTKYFWDNRNRLTRVETPTEAIEYIYDYQNRLVKRTENITNQQYFIHDDWQIILQYDNKQQAPTHRYLWGTKQDELICDNDNWQLGDHLNTIRDIVKSDSNVATHLEYNSFGKLISETKNNDSIFFAYTGKLTDNSSDLQWNINRWYDSNVGRWVSEDPIGFRAKDENLYCYVKNMPVQYYDYRGLLAQGHTIPSVDWGYLSEEQRYPGTVSGSTVGKHNCSCGTKSSSIKVTRSDTRRLITSTNTCINGTYDGLLWDTGYLYCGEFSLYRIVNQVDYQYECRKSYMYISPTKGIVSGYRVYGYVYESSQTFGNLEVKFTGTADPMNSSIDPGDILTLVGTVITVISLL